MKPAFARDSWIVTTLIAFALPAHAQTLPQSSPQNTSIRTRSEAVLLDVVVRDKRGRLVTSLTPEDFQIFDNGEHVEGGYRGWRREERAGEADLFAGRDFTFDVELRGGIVANEDGCETWANARGREQANFVF